VKATLNGTTTAYVGNYYEQTGSVTTTYYYAGGTRIAMRQGGTVNYLLGDHLGSTAIAANGTTGALMSEQRYKPWGEQRYPTGASTLPTRHRFTGQIEDGEIGLYFYGARYYSNVLGRWLSPDTIVPDPANPQSLNRFSYALNNPLRYTDPTGHWEDEGKQTQVFPCTPWPGCVTGRYLAMHRTPWQITTETIEDEKKAMHLASVTEQQFLQASKSPWSGDLSAFGGRNTLNNNTLQRHPAVDSRGNPSSPGAPIYATAYGTVVMVGDNGNTDFGKYVLIEHDVYGGKYYSVYAHLSAQYVAQGDIVDDTTAIGAMGQSGTDNIHLHFEVRKPTNVDLTQDNPFQEQVWWPQTWTALTSNFVNLGVVYGYASDFFTWKENHP
jgi:RHS repeat-associated protein